MIESKNMMWIAGVLLCTTIVGAAGTLYYRSQLMEARTDYEVLLKQLEDMTIVVDLRLNYGNGTVNWHNGTRIPVGSSLLNATMEVASVEYTVTDFGVLVTSINGLGGNSSNFWIWYHNEDGEWQYGPVGANMWILSDNDVVSWNYEDF